MSKIWLYGKTLNEVKGIVEEEKMPKFTAAQITDWLYKKNCRSIDEMTNISATNRAKLSEKYCVGTIDWCNVAKSKDGTKKYLFPTLGEKYIESAYIPDKERATLCVSSQSGCRMGCKFCMTARQGFQHHLTTGEILNQIRNISESDKLTNIVYMGMGEPLDNIDNVMRSLEIMTAEWGYAWSPTRITLSTIGVIPSLKRFLDESKVNLAVSMHNPFDNERIEMMPSQKAFPISEVVKLIKQYDFTHQRRVSFEYIMFDGVNDTSRHAREILRILRGLRSRMNLIRFHKIPDAPFAGSPERTIERFQQELENGGLITTVRVSRGEDISAACGLLSTKKIIEK